MNTEFKNVSLMTPEYVFNLTYFPPHFFSWLVFRYHLLKAARNKPLQNTTEESNAR